jgi:electron transfer flavoprotein alpha subunit
MLEEALSLIPNTEKKKKKERSRHPMVNIQSSKQIVSGGNSIGTEQEMATFFSKGTNSKYF